MQSVLLSSKKSTFFLIGPKVAFNDIYNKQRIFQHLVIDFNMELLVKIVNNFKQQTIFAKRSILHVSQVVSSPLTTFLRFSMFFTNNKRTISRFFGTVTPTTQLGFYLFKVNDRNTENTTARCEMCLKIIVRTLERRQ